MGRDLKHQVGARVPGDLLEKAKQAAAALGVSFNQWVEQAFNLKLGDAPTPGGTPTLTLTDAPIPGQTSLDGLVTPRMMSLAELKESPDAQQPDPVVEFARNCTNGTFHWKHGPGNPCRYCKGEI